MHMRPAVLISPWISNRVQCSTCNPQKWALLVRVLNRSGFAIGNQITSQLQEVTKTPNTVDNVTWHSHDIFTCVGHLAEVALEQSALEAPVLLVGTTLVAGKQLEVAAHQPELIQIVRGEEDLGNIAEEVAEVFIWIHQLVTRPTCAFKSTHCITFITIGPNRDGY